MFVIDPYNDDRCTPLEIQGDVVNEASTGLLSAHEMCRRKGYTLVWLVMDTENSNADGF